MRRLIPLVLALSCTGQPFDPHQLVVAASPSLRAPIDELARAFERAHPGARVQLLRGRPEDLVGRGVPVDVVAAESAADLQPLEAKLQERRAFGCDALVLIGRPGATRGAASKRLPAPEVRSIALADPRGPQSGAAAEAALGRLGLRREVAAKLRYLGTPRQVVDAVARGEADAGLLLARDLADATGVIVLDPQVDPGIACAEAAVLSASRRRALAHAFLLDLSASAAAPPPPENRPAAAPRDGSSPR